jgi:hypothetical protein
MRVVQRGDGRRGAAVKDPEFHSLGLVLGYDYPDSPVVVPDGSPRPQPQLTVYQPSAHPGARLPHAWLPDGSSLYDLLAAGFTLLRLRTGVPAEALLEAAAGASVPLRLLDLGHLPRLRNRYGADLVLVRPDLHVAWRGDTIEDSAEILGRVTGARLPSHLPTTA